MKPNPKDAIKSLQYLDQQAVEQSADTFSEISQLPGFDQAVRDLNSLAESDQLNGKILDFAIDVLQLETFPISLDSGPFLENFGFDGDHWSPTTALGGVVAGLNPSVTSPGFAAEFMPGDSFNSAPSLIDDSVLGPLGQQPEAGFDGSPSAIPLHHYPAPGSSGLLDGIGLLGDEPAHGGPMGASKQGPDLNNPAAQAPPAWLDTGDIQDLGTLDANKGNVEAGWQIVGGMAETAGGGVLIGVSPYTGPLAPAVAATGGSMVVNGIVNIADGVSDTIAHELSGQDGDGATQVAGRAAARSEVANAASSQSKGNDGGSKNDDDQNSSQPSGDGGQSNPDDNMSAEDPDVIDATANQHHDNTGATGDPKMDVEGTAYTYSPFADAWTSALQSKRSDPAGLEAIVQLATDAEVNAAEVESQPAPVLVSEFARPFADLGQRDPLDIINGRTMPTEQLINLTPDDAVFG